MLIAQDRPRVERYARQADEQWLLSILTGPDAALALGSIDGELKLTDIYRKIRFPEDAGPRR